MSKTNGDDEFPVIPELNYAYQGEVVEVVDGDTLVVEIDLGFHIKMERSIRLSGFNSPEIYFVESSVREQGEKSKQKMESLVLPGDFVMIKSTDYKRGMYGRIIALVWRNEDGLCLNEEMQNYMMETYGVVDYNDLKEDE